MGAKSKIEYGDVDFDYDHSDTKLRITTMVSSDVLKALKKEAKLLGIGYQTLLDAKLREIVLGDPMEIDEKAPLYEISKDIRKLKTEFKKIKSDFKEIKVSKKTTKNKK